MNAPSTKLGSALALAEWHRVELLCQCLAGSREGPGEQTITELNGLQERVNALREAGFWSSLKLPEMPFCEDLLACIYAPQILPRVGWMYQELQSSRLPTPSEALLASLLAVPDTQLDDFRKTLWQLEHRGLVHRDRPDPFLPIAADRLALSHLMDWSLEDCAPPGAYPVRRRASWDELILPAREKTMLREYLNWIKYRDQVVGAWGGQATGGPVAMFAGRSGTGKTFAACALANELGWPLFRVDLAALVSKYVGETEKNIGQLFDATHGRQVILQFDEADALMGKRAEIKEARDRYANMEVSYLLARIEEHEGPVLLTTNLRSQIDKAFCRRFHMVVEFPRPDAAQRLLLWEQLLPPGAPRTPGLNLDLAAAAITLTGGQIRNAALHAAYLAAAAEGAIGLEQIALAVHRELAKERAQVDASQLGPLAAFLPKEY